MDNNIVNKLLNQKKKKKVDNANQSNLNSYIQIKSPVCENKFGFDEENSFKWRLSLDLFKGNKSAVENKRVNFEEKQIEDNMLMEIKKNVTDFPEVYNDLGDDFENSKKNYNQPPPKVNIFQVMMKQRKEKSLSNIDLEASIKLKKFRSYNNLQSGSEIGKFNKNKRGRKRRLDDVPDLELNDSIKNCITYSSKEEINTLEDTTLIVNDFDEEGKILLGTSSVKKAYNINDIFNGELKRTANKMFERCNKNIFQNANSEEIFNEYFPTISHIQQIPTPKTLFWELPNVSLKLSNPNESVFTKNCNVHSYNKKMSNCVIKLNDVYTLNKVLNYRQSLNNIIAQHKDFAVEKLAKILHSRNMNEKPLKEDCKKVSDDKRTKKRGRKKKVELESPSYESINFTTYSKEKCTMWTEKYKPLSCEEIFTNAKSACSLRKWLSSWLEYEKNLQSKPNTYPVDYDSDFCYSDGDSNYSERIPSSGIILKGAIGSGKTSTVHAICLELGIDVIELNASSKRTGKQILQDLQEATQSHHVAKNSLINMVNHKDKKNITLLLVDDVDIVFDQDEGFISAVYQLLLTSKRPVILIASNVSCDYLDKFLIQYPLITFSRTENIFNTKIWVKLMLLFEGISYEDTSFIDKLFYFFGEDIRQIIMQLQFWLDNENNCKNSNSLDLEKMNDINCQPKSVIIYRRSIENLKLNSTKFTYLVEMWRKTEHLMNFKQAKLKFNNFKTTDTKTIDLYNTFKCFDSFSTCDYLIKSDREDFHEEPYCCLWERPLMDSLEIKPRKYSNDGFKLTGNILKYLLEGYKNINDQKHEQPDNYFYENKLKTWHEKIIKSEREFSNGIPIMCCTNKISSTLDYFPIFREISRIELHREVNNQKRGNRFYNYLRTLSLKPSATSLKVASKTFQ